MTVTSMIQVQLLKQFTRLQTSAAVVDRTVTRHVLRLPTLYHKSHCTMVWTWSQTFTIAVALRSSSNEVLAPSPCVQGEGCVATIVYCNLLQASGFHHRKYFKGENISSPPRQSSPMIAETAMAGWPGAGVKPSRPAEWTMEYGLNYGLESLLVSMPNSSDSDIFPAPSPLVWMSGGMHSLHLQASLTSSKQVMSDAKFWPSNAASAVVGCFLIVLLPR